MVVVVVEFEAVAKVVTLLVVVLRGLGVVVPILVTLYLPLYG